MINRNLSRPLLVERIGGLATAGDLNIPSLPSFAILQVSFVDWWVEVYVRKIDLIFIGPRCPWSDLWIRVSITN